MKSIINFLRDERGAIASEYAVVSLVMGAGSIGAVALLRDGQIEQFGKIEERLSIDNDATGAAGNTGIGGGGGGE
ncbi:MAG: hypothetical protein VXY94_11815 [Planctomycetota bacterium]|nr:hypothetical protein [Planctomycetota bacterium]MEC8560752.1 hypothetical protein [Planctomycetota bacterium]MEC8735056.1 hypothetical protein [Planctomycetota bacterium]MEC9157175.1 hypothetical protein [Planctomycetota bacterium]MEC9233840.1 hypothetical protein [Planctomycetota bacterium]